ncbi:glycoside hydrolase family 88 protein [Streptomyces sp. bgisy032]|uniref:glycoside hydrolase family 88 protein n=1 Tax=Streptomyces sp. bgisy032 TaxID=3413773 RepID=UPI003D73D2D0
MGTSERTPQGLRSPAAARPASLAVDLYDHYERTGEVKAYYGLLALYALARVGRDTENPAVLDHVERVLRRFPDEIAHPPYNFPSYRIGGMAQSFLLAQGRMPERREWVREYAEEMKTAPRDDKGILKLPHTSGDLIWIDAAMAATPFLLYAGQALRERRYLDEAVDQAVLLYDELLDPANGLLHQCRGFIAPGVLSQDHWGRGNGWGYFALAELVRGLAHDDPRRGEVVSRFRALSQALLPHQSPRGLWRQEIPLPTAWEESSGTGLILYGIGTGIECGVLEGPVWRDALRRGLTGLTATCVNQDFSIENSCPGTLCPGTGAAKGTVEAYLTAQAPYRDEPHGCGPLILALSVAPAAGVDCVVLRAEPQQTTFLEPWKGRHAHG